MKTAIYIDDGCTQLVLTPETDIDKQVIAELESGYSKGVVKCFRGEFYECRGGWVRHGKAEPSLFLRVNPKLSGETPANTGQRPAPPPAKDPPEAGATLDSALRTPHSAFP